MSTVPTPPPASCPIGWQPQALAPVFYGARSLGPADGAPVPLRVFFPSVDGSVETAPLLAGCGRYPLVIFAHGNCIADTNHYRRWARLPAQLARSGYVVVAPLLANIASGYSPTGAEHHDIATLEAVLTWARSGWQYAGVLLSPPATGVVGHSFGAMLGARFAVGRQVSAFVGLSGGWQDWSGGAPFPLPLLDIPTLLIWGGGGDTNSPLPEARWQQIRRPRHRVIFATGMHWDYLSPVEVPCNHSGHGTCAALGPAADDLVTMFLGRYLPPELATDLPGRIPPTLEPPALALTPQQEFFAGGFLVGYAGRGSNPACAVTLTADVEHLVANTRSHETHSLDHPCAWVSMISQQHRWQVSARPTGYQWCDLCYPGRADG